MNSARWRRTAALDSLAAYVDAVIVIMAIDNAEGTAWGVDHVSPDAMTSSVIPEIDRPVAIQSAIVGADNARQNEGSIVRIPVVEVSLNPVGSTCRGIVEPHTADNGTGVNVIHVLQI